MWFGYSKPLLAPVGNKHFFLVFNALLLLVGRRNAALNRPALLPEKLFYINQMSVIIL